MTWRGVLGGGRPPGPGDPRELDALRARVAELEQQVRDAHAFVNTILDTIPDPIFVKNEHHAWILLNQAFCDFMGHPREALLGRSDHDFFPKAEADVFWKLDDALFATGQTNENEESFTDGFGEVHVISTKKALCLDPAGNKVLAGVIRDITARVHDEEALKRAHEELEARVAERTADLEQANAQLRQSEERFRSTFEQAAVGIAHVSLEGRFLRVNQRLCEILGYPTDELLGLSFRDLTFPDDLDTSDAALAGLAGGGPSLSFDKRYVRKDGRVVWTHLTSNTARDPAGRPAYLITVLEDVGARKAAEEALQRSEAKLRQAQKMEAVGRLAGGVAHDFNNLLLVMSGCSELAMRDAPAGTRVHALLSEVLNASERAASLTRQLLAFSRQQVLQPRVVDLNGLIGETASMLRRVIGEDIDLRADRTPDLGLVRVDPGQIVQVLMNLSVNSRDAMPEGGSLTIRTTNARLEDADAERFGVPPGEYVALLVTDTGRGMDAETQARLFEPFFTTKEPGKGTGLGLSTVYGIVQQSDGAITVQSEVGRGTTFRVYLPRVDPDATPEAAAVPGAESARRAETVLLVDDEAAVRDVVRQLLEVNGYRVLAAATPEEALAIAEAHREPIHHLLTDVVMPRMNGRQVAERVAQLHPEARVLYMSGYAPDAVVHQGMLDAGSAFLQKPFDEEGLLHTLRRPPSGRGGPPESR